MPYFTAVFNMRNQITVKLLLWLWALLVVVEFVAAATCSLKPSSTPVTAAGWASQLIVQNLRGPRGIIFDSAGNLLVVEQGSGVVHLRFEDGGGTCLDVASKTYLINSTDVSPLFLPICHTDRPSSIMASPSQTTAAPSTPPPRIPFIHGPMTPPPSPSPPRTQPS